MTHCSSRKKKTVVPNMASYATMLGLAGDFIQPMSKYLMTQDDLSSMPPESKAQRVERLAYCMLSMQRVIELQQKVCDFVKSQVLANIRSTIGK